MAEHALSAVARHRGEDGYEPARRAAVWNGRLPDRFPDLVVQARDTDDVLAAVAEARRRGARIGVRSGGHSWAANHCRDGGMLLDVSRLDEVVVDRDAMRARVGPGALGNVLLERLAAEGLFFPAGHCPGVALGGYLLQGGFGWNGRVHGPACMSVEAVDVVTASGELVRADAHSEPDLLWAARGAGPGFFGVVVAFHLRLYELPKAIANGVHVLGVEMLDEVFSWAHRIGPSVPPAMELMVFLHRGEHGVVQVVVTGPVLMDSEQEAREALALLETCPGLDRASISVPFVSATLADLYAGVASTYPDGRRYAVDNMWTHAPAEQLLPGLHRIAETLPEAPSHMLWMNWRPGRQGGSLRRRRARPSASRTTPTSPSTGSGATRATTRRGSRGRPIGCERWSRSRAASSSPTRTSGAARRRS